MFLDTQNQFDPQHLEAPYAQAYAEFAEENKAVLYTWGKEEVTQRFSEHLSKKVEKELLVLIDARPVDEAKKKELITLAKRQQLLLVSTDEGKTFDQFLTLQEARQAQPLNYTIKSPTFRNSTTNLVEVVEEQTLLYVVKNMNENFTALNGAEKTIWSVKNAVLKNGVVQVEVNRTASNVEAEDANNLKYEVVVDQEATRPFDYKQIDKNGKEKHISETQLFEEYGEAQEDKSLQRPTQEAVTRGLVMQSSKNNPAAGALLATGLTMLAMQEAKHHASPEQRAREAAALAQASIEQPLMHREGGAVPNVMAAKAAMASLPRRPNAWTQDAVTP